MPPKQLSDAAKAYVLEEFDKGSTPGQILNAFRATGQRNFSLATIEKCLQDNGRNMYSYNLNTASQGYKELSKHLPPIMPQRVNPYAEKDQAVSATTNPYGQGQQPTSNDASGRGAYNHPHVLQPATGSGAPQASAQAQENLAPVYQWNDRADAFALSAYRVGQTASQIAGQLRNNGYDDITVGEVVASLNRQGFTNVVW